MTTKQTSTGSTEVIRVDFVNRRRISPLERQIIGSGRCRVYIDGQRLGMGQDLGDAYRAPVTMEPTELSGSLGIMGPWLAEGDALRRYDERERLVAEVVCPVPGGAWFWSVQSQHVAESIESGKAATDLEARAAADALIDTGF